MSLLSFTQSYGPTYRSKGNCVGSRFNGLVFRGHFLAADVLFFSGQLRNQPPLRFRELRRPKPQKFVCSHFSRAESGSEASSVSWNDEKKNCPQEGQISTTNHVTSSPETDQLGRVASEKLTWLWRWRVFHGIFVSYLAYTICRTCDLLLPSLLWRILGSGLSLAGLTNVGLGLSDGYRWFAFWWGANGIAQGCGAGACARILTAWFKSSERGFWWALWSCSANNDLENRHDSSRNIVIDCGSNLLTAYS
ncbi:Probable hexose phosphate transport protein [Galdieria sulphuraria]|nr:Probable hexose phosphate transport protein [Galdieria sulphuraria]